ncbi:MAG: type II toxin-antitoxin system VapB family antitoxin [Acidimicrobiales bacterium]
MIQQGHDMSISLLRGRYIHRSVLVSTTAELDRYVAPHRCHSRAKVIAVLSSSQEVNLVPDILIRDLPDHVLAAIDANAQRLGLSRNEYLRRQLASEARPHPTVTVADLRRSAAVFADLNDPTAIAGAWA